MTEPYVNPAEIPVKQNENVALGVLGALLFSVAGGLAHFGLMQFGYIAAIIMNLTMPHTFMTTDASGAAVEATKSWVMNWSAVGDAAWFALPKFLPVKLGFDIRAIPSPHPQYSTRLNKSQ